MRCLSWLIIAMLTAAAPVKALDNGQHSIYDYRIKSVLYNPQDVVKINAIAGVATHIVVGADETYVTHVFGDSQSWAFTHVNNHFFIKPLLALGDTNLTIVTDKHNYNIVLHYIDTDTRAKAAKSSPWARNQATLQLTYLYPQQLQQQALEKKLQHTRFTGLKNYHYIMSDEPPMRPIQPLSVVDNHQFTRFIFPPMSELPQIYMRSATGEEQLVNTRVVGEQHNIIEAEGIAPEWRIRLGEKVVGVRNIFYSPAAGTNASGTASPAVKRVTLKGDEE
ncbi:TrbG/VirB9 family P-type conjugative transfer protein [Rosenbergiella epipactidis]|uniref:TrbG/VirB9 family P-type conjugative transfer protein n=1 Tax=Rosenbergiella epipactidis TaxID=1544694 RepID=UPI001F4F6149|nr:TrbG/VirB9 family P-type conjugative transfer protein [Rosenbergiella epipactidis]